MTIRSRLHRLLSILLPAGVLGVSSALASAHAAPAATLDTNAGPPQDKPDAGVAARLQAIRNSVSDLDAEYAGGEEADPRILLAQWVNFGGGGVGWRNGGWGNGGWRNAPWRNGWGNGGWHNWGNGGWHNWGNGGWHNFWRNW